MKEKLVNQIRAFHRFYLPAFGLLGNRYLGSEYSAAEARVLFEVYRKEGCTATDIAKTLNIDKSYLSRVIRSHERKGYLKRIVSAADSRAYELHLTERGIERTQDFIRKSNEQIGGIIAPLTEEQCQRLLIAFDTIAEVLRGEYDEDSALR